MGIVKVDTSNEKLLKQPEYKVLPPGKHLFEVANDLKVEKAKTSDNNIVNLEAVCQDDGEFKGAKVFDCLPLSKKAQWKIAQFACACGITTPAELKETGDIDLEAGKGSIFEAITGVADRQDGTGTVVGKKTTIVRYLFAGEEGDKAAE